MHHTPLAPAGLRQWFRALRRTLGQRTRIARPLVLLFALLASATFAADLRAAEVTDLTGTWACCGAGGAAAQNFVITSGKGSLAGEGQLPGGQVFSTITGSVAGDAVTIVTTYNGFSPGYVATFVGTLSPDKKTITGTWTSNRGQSGTWTATGAASDLKISGTVRQLECSGTGCAKRGLGGVLVRATGGPDGPKDATTASNGSYSIEVDKGTWKVTPTLDGRRFSPLSKSVNVTSEVKGVDFETCARQKTQNAGAKTPVVCDPDDIDWTMPPRIQNQPSSWSAAAILPYDFVHPGQWKVDLQLSSKGSRLAKCPKGDRWSWTVTAPKGAKVLRKPADGCTSSMVVSELGTYKVTATNTRGGDVVDRLKDRKVIVKDWLIAGIGDSNGSGEGNPEFEVNRCNRGTASYQYQTAKFVEDTDERSSVTFLFASCSGASITHLYQRGYAGVRPETPELDPQIPAIAGKLVRQRASAAGKQTDRDVDVALISIGVNDLGFGPVLETCVFAGFRATFDSPGCEDQGASSSKNALTGQTRVVHVDGGQTTLRQVVKVLQDQLPAKYPPLQAALRAKQRPQDGGFGMTDMKRVFFTTYPDFASGSDGLPCDTATLQPFGESFVPVWRRPTWAWLQEQSGVLNANVAKGAASIGAQVVNIPATEFHARGYCAKDSYIAPLLATTLAGDAGGPFHPNRNGHLVASKYNRGAVCTKLYGNPNCDGKPKA